MAVGAVAVLTIAVWPANPYTKAVHQERTGDDRWDKLRGRIEVVCPFDLVPGYHELDGHGDGSGHDEIADSLEVSEGQNTIPGNPLWATSISQCFQCGRGEQYHLHLRRFWLWSQ